MLSLLQIFIIYLILNIIKSCFIGVAGYRAETRKIDTTALVSLMTIYEILTHLSGSEGHYLHKEEVNIDIF